MEVCLLAKYIAKRLLYMGISLWLIITVTFFLMRLAPGNPFTSEKNCLLKLRRALMSITVLTSHGMPSTGII